MSQSMQARSIDQATIADFGEQWTRYVDNDGYYGSSALFADIVGPLLPLVRIRGARVADIGSGTGRIVAMLLGLGAKEVIAVEPSAAIKALRSNLGARADNVHYIHADGTALPPGADLDLVTSIGVLHHIVDPAPVLAAAYAALKPGGSVLVWLYGREGNAAYLRLIEPLRRLTRHLPAGFLTMLCWLMNLGLSVYMALCRFLPLPMYRYARAVLAKLPSDKRRLVIYDQLNPAYAKYCTRSDVEALLRDAGFTDVSLYHRHDYSWTAVGKRPLGGRHST